LKFPQGNLAELVLEMAVMDKISLFGKGLGAIRAKIGPTSDVDNIFSKMYSQYMLFRNKYS
jgi:hypothetical protein